MSHPWTVSGEFHVAPKSSKLAGERSKQAMRLKQYKAPKIDLRAERIQAAFNNFDLSGDDSIGVAEDGLHTAYEAQKQYRLNALMHRGSARLSGDKVTAIVADLKSGMGVLALCKKHHCGKDTISSIKDLMG